jgi:hypothetical protein
LRVFIGAGYHRLEKRIYRRLVEVTPAGEWDKHSPISGFPVSLGLGNIYELHGGILIMLGLVQSQTLSWLLLPKLFNVVRFSFYCKFQIQKIHPEDTYRIIIGNTYVDVVIIILFNREIISMKTVPLYIHPFVQELSCLRNTVFGPIYGYTIQFFPEPVFAPKRSDHAHDT